MKKITSFFAAAAMTAVMFCSAVTASAESLVKPKVSAKKTYADQIVLSVDNAKTFPGGTSFAVSRSDRAVTKVSRNFASSVLVDDCGITYLKPNTAYTFTVTPVLSGNVFTELSTKIKVRTAEQTSYKIKKGIQAVKISGGKITVKKNLTSEVTAHGVLAAANGTEVAGKNVSAAKSYYVKLTDGSCKGWYVKKTQAVRIAEPVVVNTHEQEVAATRKLICDYAASMDGGRYVWGGTDYRACDCSGLVMISYAQAGIYITHSSYGQETLGIPVSFDEMEPGDIIGMNYGGHVGLYLGNGKLVHALNPNDGIKITPLSYLQYFHIDCVRRLVY